MSNNSFTPIQMAGMPLLQRRLLVAALNIGTIVYLLWTTFTMFRPGGITLLEAFILFCASISTPPHVIYFWNCIIGLWVNTFGNPEKSIYPYFDAKGPLPEITSQTALVICMCNEDPAPILSRLHAMRESLLQTGRLQHFRFIILSDTSRPDVMEMEDKGFADLAKSLGMGMSRAPLYRRRIKNTGYKAGNIKDYVDNHSEGDDLFVTLDSDSAMGGDVLVRLVSSMEKHPQIGLLQTQFAGMPAVSTFTRLWQFGLRYSVPVQNVASNWWVNDCAFYWGHNAIIRTRAFHKHCMLPVLPGKPPLGGHILSHDVMEGMFMRRAGYEVRMIPLETESYETNPPTLLDFLRREHRWCQGTMQYWFLLKEPGLKSVSRFQVCQILASYLGPAFGVLWILAGIANGMLGGYEATQFEYRFVAHLIMIGIWLIPKIACICTSFDRYGSGFRYAVSLLLEIILMQLIWHVISVAITVFFFSLVSGKSISWDGQNRDRLGLSWRESFRVLWPQTLVGFSIAGLLALEDNITWLWALPFVTSLCLATPFAVITASPRLSQIITRLRLFLAPEEAKLPPLLSVLVAPEIIYAFKAAVTRRLGSKAILEN